MTSYWEKSFVDYDVVVVGAGITGLSVALSVRDAAPGYRIAVLERGIFPEGASLRNAGFACIGSLTEVLDDLDHLGEEKVLELVDMRLKGLSLLKRRLGERQIGYRERGSYELLAPEDPAFARMEGINALLLPVTGSPAFSRADERVSSFGFARSSIGGMIRNHLEGEIDTGKMMSALRDLAHQQRITVLTGCGVTRIEENMRWIHLEGGGRRFRARFVAVCTNAFTQTLFPAVEVSPARGQVLLTERIENLPFQGIFHFDKGYYYFREIDGRILLGGGRNLDFQGETTMETGVTDLIQQDLERKLRELILPGREVKIAMRWSGIMGFGKTKFPRIGPYSRRIFMAVGMGGMGIAIASEAGRRLAGMLLASRI